VTAPDSREAMQDVVVRCRVARDAARMALSSLRGVEVTSENVSHVNHIEREITEAIARLIGARFAADAALAKEGQS
jgi:hypothetical protein